MDYSDCIVYQFGEEKYVIVNFASQNRIHVIGKVMTEYDSKEGGILVIRDYYREPLDIKFLCFKINSDISPALEHLVLNSRIILSGQ